MISSEEFRKALRHFPAGVTIVTVKGGEQVHGLTVSAFASVSAEPPLIMIIIENRHHAHTLLEEPDAVFAVNILGEEQSELSNRFAWVKDEDRFAMGDWTTADDRRARSWWTPWPGSTAASTRATRPAPTPSTWAKWWRADVPMEEAPPLVYWNRGYRKLHLHEEEPK